MIVSSFSSSKFDISNLSAGTFSYVFCEKCQDGNGGVTLIEIPTPHPTYTNLNGKAVVQLQMVELGGINGLNFYINPWEELISGHNTINLISEKDCLFLNLYP